MPCIQKFFELHNTRARVVCCSVVTMHCPCPDRSLPLEFHKPFCAVVSIDPTTTRARTHTNSFGQALKQECKHVQQSLATIWKAVIYTCARKNTTKTDSHNQNSCFRQISIFIKINILHIGPRILDSHFSCVLLVAVMTPDLFVLFREELSLFILPRKKIQQKHILVDRKS